MIRYISALSQYGITFHFSGHENESPLSGFSNIFCVWRPGHSSLRFDLKRITGLIRPAKEQTPSYAPFPYQFFKFCSSTFCQVAAATSCFSQRSTVSSAFVKVIFDHSLSLAHFCEPKPHVTSLTLTCTLKVSHGSMRSREGPFNRKMKLDRIIWWHGNEEKQ